MVSRFGDDGVHRVRSAKLLGTVLHLQRGTPYVYQGEELGMTNAPFAGIDDYRDIESLNHYREALAMGADPDELLAALRAMSRDHARTPMQWDATEHAGFTDGEPWIAVNPNHTEVNAAASVADPDSVFHHYRELIALRKSEPAVAHGDLTMLLEDDPVVYAFTRRLGETELLVVANFSGEPVVPDLPAYDEWLAGDLLLGNVPGSAGVELAAWEARVHRRTSHAMTTWLIVAGVVLGLWVLSCLLMMLLAHRLPNGLLRQVAEFLPACVTTARTLRKHPDVPRRAKVALLVAVLWVVSPIDLLPEFLPIIGPLDDVVAVVLLLRYAARSIPRETLLAAWPTDPTLLERLLRPVRRTA